MSQNGGYDPRNGNAQNQQNLPPAYQYDPYRVQYATQQPKQEKKKPGGSIGIVVACTLSAALIGGMLGGLGGMAIGYNLAPAQQNVQGMEELQSAVEDLAARVLEGELQLSAAGAFPVANANAGMSVADIAKKVSPSVVAINTMSTSRQSTFFGTYESENPGSGSGVIISGDGYIVTNHHVIAGANSIKVILQGGTEYDAELVGRDRRTDIAILKIDASGLPAVEIGDSANLSVGDIAVAIGNPLGELAGSVTQGIISAKEREITIENTSMNLLQFDAPVNPGNSGGALVNARGQLVGIVNAKTQAVGVEGIGFAIPIDDVKDVIDDIVKVGYVTGRLKVGISTKDVTEEIHKAYDLPIGAYIGEIEEFSAAERAGLKVGDVIIRFDGEKITEGARLSQIRDLHKAGDVIEVVVIREGKELTFELVLLEDITGD